MMDSNYASQAIAWLVVWAGSGVAVRQYLTGRATRHHHRHPQQQNGRR